MNISFSTIDVSEAKRRLAMACFGYFNEKQKELIIKYVGQKHVRVQDPMMYPSPSVEIQGNDSAQSYAIRNEIQGAGKQTT